MLKWTGTNGVQVGCDWFDTGCIFTSLYLDEVIGGRFPFGRIKLISSGSDEFMDKVLNSPDINITLGTSEKGEILNIHGIITNKEFFDSSVTLEFESLPNADFFRKRVNKRWELPILETIKALWGGKIDQRPEAITDIGEDPPSYLFGTKKGFLQTNEPNCELLGTLLGSYMNNFVYAIGLDGLLMKGLIGTDSTGHKEPYWTVTGKGDTMTPTHDGPGTEDYRINYDKRLYMEPEDAWDTLGSSLEDVRSKYWDIKEFDNTLRYINKEGSRWKMRQNLINNQKIYESVMYNQMTLMKNDFVASTYRLGDVIRYLRPGDTETEVPWEIYIISGIQYYVNAEPDRESDGSPFKQIYTLHCLQEKGKTLPGVGEDPLT